MLTPCQQLQGQSVRSADGSASWKHSAEHSWSSSGSSPRSVRQEEKKSRDLRAGVCRWWSLGSEVLGMWQWRGGLSSDRQSWEQGMWARLSLPQVRTERKENSDSDVFRLELEGQVTLDCHPRSEGVNTECRSLPSGDNNVQCYCDSDLCNTAPVSHPSVLAILTILLARPYLQWEVPRGKNSVTQTNVVFSSLNISWLEQNYLEQVNTKKENSIVNKIMIVPYFFLS